MRNDKDQAFYTKKIIEKSNHRLSQLPMELYLLINKFRYISYSIKKLNISNCVINKRIRYLFLKDVRLRRNVRI